MRKFICFTIACAALALFTASAQAQRFGRNRNVQVPAGQAQPQQQQAPAAQAQGFQPSPHSDAEIVTMLNIGNRVEIALSQFAEQKSDNAELKKMAREMIDDHTKFTQELNRFAGTMGQAQAAPGQQPAAQPFNQQPGQQPVAGQQPAANQQPFNQQPGQQPIANQQPAQQQPVANQQPPQQQPGQFAQPRQEQFAANAGMAHLPWMQVSQQLSDQCIQSKKHELEEQKAKRFDHAFAGCQIGAHVDAIDKIKVLRGYASPQLQQVLAQGEQTAEHHLAQWKQFMEKTEKDLESNRTP